MQQSVTDTKQKDCPSVLPADALVTRLLRLVLIPFGVYGPLLKIGMEVVVPCEAGNRPTASSQGVFRPSCARYSETGAKGRPSSSACRAYPLDQWKILTLEGEEKAKCP